MLLAVVLRRVGAVVALLGIGCLLVALLLPWFHFEPNRIFPYMAHALPRDYSVLFLFVADDWMGLHFAEAAFTLYLLPLLGSCCVVVEVLRAWQGRAATLLGSALLLLSMGCALFGLATIPRLVGIGAGIMLDGPPMLPSAGTGARLASLGFVAVVAGGVLLAAGGLLLASGALLHRWTLRRTNPRDSATTTG